MEPPTTDTIDDLVLDDKGLTVNIGGEALQELERIADLTRHPKDDLLAIAIRITGMVADAQIAGNRVVVMAKHGRPLKEIFVTPRTRKCL